MKAVYSACLPSLMCLRWFLVRLDCLMEKWIDAAFGEAPHPPSIRVQSPLCVTADAGSRTRWSCQALRPILFASSLTVDDVVCGALSDDDGMHGAGSRAMAWWGGGVGGAVMSEDVGRAGSSQVVLLGV